jgi:hypothetical protein
MTSSTFIRRIVNMPTADVTTILMHPSLVRSGICPTFDTDYLLVKKVDYPKAVTALRAAGHLVDAEEVGP